MGGATDAYGIQLSGTGVLTGCISVPSRYIHSAVGCVHLDDMEGAVELILAFIADVSANGLPDINGSDPVWRQKACHGTPVFGA